MQAEIGFIHPFTFEGIGLKAKHSPALGSRQEEMAHRIHLHSRFCLVVFSGLSTERTCLAYFLRLTPMNPSSPDPKRSRAEGMGTASNSA